jgi:hypothetical protein
MYGSESEPTIVDEDAASSWWCFAFFFSLRCWARNGGIGCRMSFDI